jgi:hypothetical protein
MKTKIGVITYHASHNIGSMLQTYALQYILTKKFGCEVEIIDFSSKAQQNMYSIFPKVENYKVLIKNIINFMFYPIIKSRFNDFEKFISNHFKLTKRSYDNLELLSELDGRFDYVICGSDQIWNVNCTDFDDAYFLPFISSSKKISYAPSLGGRNILTSNVDIEKYKKYINDFDSLSVREVNGKAWLDQLSGRDFSIVADPTLLVSGNVWDELASERLYDGDYIFFYGVPFSPITYDIVVELSKKLDMPIVMLDAKSWLYKGNLFKGIKLSKNGSPTDYLSLIKYSKLVITTSFHGSIFASLFKKNFWTVTYKGTNLDDDRVKTLLDQLGLENRFIYLEDYKKHNILEDIDYSNYDQRLEKFKSKSLGFLAKSIEKTIEN